MIDARQMTLPLPAPAAGESPFIAAESNAAALSWLAASERWPGGRMLLVAEACAGKTHLLTQWASDRGGACVAGADLDFPPPGAPALAIDDADRAAEEPLLHALNAASERGGLVLMSARAPAARWPIRLPDLASRLRAVPAVAIGAADEPLLRLLLGKFLAERQLAVPEPVREWLLCHLPRNPVAIREAARLLDRALAPGSRATQALASRVVDELAAWRPSEG